MIFDPKKWLDQAVQDEIKVPETLIKSVWHSGPSAITKAPVESNRAPIVTVQPLTGGMLCSGAYLVAHTGVAPEILLNDVVNIDLTRQHIDWYRSVIGGKK